jgi:hypothetical protein
MIRLSAVEDLERRVATLENIGIDAITADRELQLFISQVGGTDTLLAHSAGKPKPDDQIATLITAAKKTSEAAGRAKAAQRQALLSHLEHVHGKTIGVNLATHVGPKAIHLIALDIFNGHQWPS